MDARLLRRVVDPPVMEFEVDGDVSLYPPGSEEALVLNRTASEVWRLLAEPIALDDLVAQLAQRYELAPDDIAADVRAVVDTLVTRGVVLHEPTAG